MGSEKLPMSAVKSMCRINSVQRVEVCRRNGIQGIRTGIGAHVQRIASLVC